MNMTLDATRACEDLKDLLSVNKEIIESPASKNNKEFQDDLLCDLNRPKLAF